MAEVTDPERRFYQYIVVGCGGVGSATVYWLSKRVGSDVLGIEQFHIGHDNGGSQDHSRIIRLAYHDDRYTKITPDTYTAWEEVEKESGIQLVYHTGGIKFAKKNELGHVIDQYADAMSKHGIKYERLTGSQLHKKYPQFETDDSYTALYEEQAGLVDAAMSISVQIQLARAHGASVIDNCPVKRIDKAPNGHILVYTANGIYQCRRLLVTSGAWINNVLQSIGVHVPIYVTQEQVSYFATPHVKDFTKEKYPIWIYHGSDRDYYGLPSHGNSGSKCGIEMGGVVVTPETRTYIPDPVREKYVTDFLKETIPRSLGPIMYTKTCLYTMPKDRHFVVDHCGKMRPGWENVIVCNGAGHCFKFSCLLGKILSEMAVDGKTQYDVSKFNINRPAITQPGWTPEMYSETGGKVPVGTPTSKL